MLVAIIHKLLLQLFGGVARRASVEGEEQEEAPEAYEAQVDFKPIVPLPPKIEVRTGEENEEVLAFARSFSLSFFSALFRCCSRIALSSTDTIRERRSIRSAEWAISRSSVTRRESIVW